MSLFDNKPKGDIARIGRYRILTGARERGRGGKKKKKKKREDPLDFGCMERPPD